MKQTLATINQCHDKNIEWEAVWSPIQKDRKFLIDTLTNLRNGLLAYQRIWMFACAFTGLAIVVLIIYECVNSCYGEKKRAQKRQEQASKAAEKEEQLASEKKDDGQETPQKGFLSKS